MAGRALAFEFGFDQPASAREVPGSSSRAGQVVPMSDLDAEPKFGLDSGEGLRKYMLREFKLGRMTAEAVCTLSFHACRAGATGVYDLALDPASHKQAEHLRHAIHMRSNESFYNASIPMWNKWNQERDMYKFPMYLPHEAFAKNYARDPAAFDPAQNDGAFLPPSYVDHELYLSKGALACPIGYFPMPCLTPIATRFSPSIGAASSPASGS